MTIEEPVNPPLDVVRAASARPDVVAACDEAASALTTLRFHEGLRRGWREARAEAAVREAAAVSILLGARTSVDEMRALTLADARGELGELDPGSALGVGVWRSQFHLCDLFDPLNAREPARKPVPTLPALLAALHRDLCSGLVACGRLDAVSVAVPASPADLAYARSVLRASLPALVVVAAIEAHFRFRTVFDPASAGVGAALARWVLVSRGLDPTGVCALSAADALEPGEASRALAGWVSADEDGIARWTIHVARSVVYGAEVGADIAFHVQAGRLG